MTVTYENAQAEQWRIIGDLVAQAEIAANQLIKNPATKQYAPNIRRKIKALKARPTAKGAYNTIADLKHIAETSI
jgi:hypothetical protein